MSMLVNQAEMQVRQALSRAAAQAAAAGELPQAELPPFTVEVPADRKNGDLAVNAAMVSARAFHAAPRKIAETLLAHLSLENSLLSRAEVAGPGFMNFNSGLFILLAGFMNLRYMGITVWDSVPLFILYALMVYVGASLLCSAFPLVEDAMNLYDLLYRQKKGNIIGRIFAFIPTVITYAGAYLEKYCITFVLVAAGVTAGFLF